MNGTKAAVAASAVTGKVLTAIGYIGMLLSLFAVFLRMSDPEGGYLVTFMYTLFTAVFIIIIILGSMSRRRVKRFRQYVFLISEKHMTSIEDIADSTLRDAGFVKRDLGKMIEMQYFNDAVIDLKKDEIVINGRSSSYTTLLNKSQKVQMAMRSELTTYSCPECGAPGIKIKNILSTCEYCGTLIK